MAFLSMALVIGAVTGAFVAGGALDQGFAIEVAMVRGAVAFMAIAFAGYLGELVIVTAPKREEQATPRADASETSEAPGPPRTLPSPPQLMASAASAAQGADDDNEDDADVELRSAA